MTNKKALAALTVTVLLWGTSFVAIRDGLTHFSPGALALLRFLMASIAMIPVYLYQSPRSKISWKVWPGLFLIGAIGMGIYNIVLNIGEITVSASIASFIASQMPVATIIVAMFVFHERITPFSWVGIIISIVGIALIAFGETHELGHFNIGILFVVMAVFCGSFYAVFQKHLLKKVKPLELTAWAMWFGTLSLMGYAPTLIHEVIHQQPWNFFSPAYLGIGSGVIGYACWSYGFKHFPATKAASFLFGMPIVATIVGWILLSEVPTMISLIGGLMALSGAFIVRTKKSVVVMPVD